MDYKLATSTWDDKELKAIQQVIDSNNFTMGEKVSKYEENFANFFNSKHALMTSSGSTANLLMIASLFFTKNKEHKIFRGDEIIVPAVSWSTTYFPLQQYGLKVKFVDIDIDTLNFDLKALKDSISEKTKLIFAVNLLGNPNDFKEISKIIGNRSITLIEDNCESMGAKFNNQFTGTFGLMSSFSSFFSHHISTMEGGMILTNDDELFHILLTLRAHGWTRNLPIKNLVTGRKENNEFKESFKFVLPGYNVRPLEMSGAIGIEQLKKLPNFLKQRLKNAELFTSLFSNHPFIRIQKSIDESSWFGFSLILKESSPKTREEIIDVLKKNQIDTRPIVTGNFVDNEVLDYFDYEVHKEMINADYLDKNGFFVGNHQNDLTSEIQHLHKVLSNL
tara:strand:+ start:4139 stop:5311 length:1173 start_codon:yes stop_codon:yes gene_type:complete